MLYYRVYFCIGQKANYEQFNFSQIDMNWPAQSINHSMIHRNKELKQTFSRRTFLSLRNTRIVDLPEYMRTQAHTWLGLLLQCAEFGDGECSAAMEFENMKWIMLALPLQYRLRRHRRFCACMRCVHGPWIRRKSQRESFSLNFGENGKNHQCVVFSITTHYNYIVTWFWLGSLN